MKLSEELQHFVSNWGELAAHWGLNRTEASVHALLFISPDSLTMEEIAEVLQVARSNVSNSLKELERWKIISRVGRMGDRRKHYTAEKDVWIMFRHVFAEQKRRNIDSFTYLLQQTGTALKERNAPNELEKHARMQIESMQVFFDTAMTWYAQLESMPVSAIRTYLSWGTKIKHVLAKKKN